MPGMHGMPEAGRVVFNATNALARWEFTPFALTVLVAAITVGIWYVRAQWSLSLRGRAWSPKRTVSFLAGLVAIDLALQSSVATFSMDYFQAHVVQHLLLMVVGPPLLAMGAPMTLALQTSSRTTKVRLLKVLNSRAFRLVTHPLPVWAAYYFSMFVFFLTVALGVAMNHMWLMDLVNLAFLLASTLFWWPIIGVDPIPHWQMSHGARLTSLLIGVPLESFLALALLSSTRPAAPMYSLASTHSGAAILWIGAEVFTFLALIPVFSQWVRFEERKAARYDAQLDAEGQGSGPSGITVPVADS
jgi:putative membrane protein